MNKLLHLAIVVCLVVLSTSCVSSRKVNYLQDMTQDSKMPLNGKFEAVICPADELTIMVLSNGGDDELVKPFNISVSNSNEIQGLGYLVDVNGDIQFPILGKVHAAGLSRLQLEELIKTKLEENRYISNPMVDVRFKTFKIFFLGAEGGKVVNISKERCTFLEALSESGFANLNTRKDKIGVLREVNGKMVMRYLDPRSSEVFNDPFFLLQQNDIIVTESYSNVYLKENWTTVATTLSSITTLATLGMLIYSNFIK